VRPVPCCHAGRLRLCVCLSVRVCPRVRVCVRVRVALVVGVVSVCVRVCMCMYMCFSGPNAVVIIKPRTIPKTSSGKIARARTRWSFEGRPQSAEDNLQVLFKWHQGDKVVRAKPNPRGGGSSDAGDVGGAGGADGGGGGGSKSAAPSSISGTGERGAGACGGDAAERPRNARLLDTPKAQELLAKLKADVILLLPDDSGVTPDAIDERRSLLQLGLDSMLLEQFKSSLQEEYQVQVDIEMLFQNITTLELVVELLLEPEPTLALLREEVEKHRVAEPDPAAAAAPQGAEGSEAAAGTTGADDGVAVDAAAAASKPGGPLFVDADETEDQRRQLSTPCSNGGCCLS
jgi:hypothetical protein